MPSYTGLYVERLSTGAINSVRVLDANGSACSLDPDRYVQSDSQPPIEQLPNMEAYAEERAKRELQMGVSTFLQFLGWVTLAALVLAMLAGALSLDSDCAGAGDTSEQCVWAKALFPVTAGLYLLGTWPACLVAGLLVQAWWRRRHP